MLFVSVVFVVVVVVPLSVVVVLVTVVVVFPVSFVTGGVIMTVPLSPEPLVSLT